MKAKQVLDLWKLRTAEDIADPAKLPKHVAIIMDGNGRWAKQHKLSVSRGHRQGTETLREIIRHTDDLGIGSLSLYAFSTENWSRPPEEVAALMQLILDFFASEIDELDEKNVRILILGDNSALQEKQRKTLLKAESRPVKKTGLQLEKIGEQTISDHLYTRGQPEVDLMIRTSGEMRLSNFMLYQNAYAEFVFPKVLWPDFTVAEYDRCLAEFEGRNRRYGGRAPEPEERPEK